MAEMFFPSALNVSGSEWLIADNAGRFQSPLSGVTRVVARPGDRWKASLRISNVTTAGRAALQSLIASMRGGINSVWVKDHSYTKRGSFPATELVTNNTFEDGTTGWTGSNATISVADQVLKMTSQGIPTQASVYRTATVTALVPYVFRSMLVQGRGSIPSFGNSTSTTTNHGTSYGMLSTASIHITSSTNVFPLVYNNTTAYSTQDYILTPYCSLSRCALVDNGPNLLRASDKFSSDSSPELWTNTRTTDAANSAVDPIGTSTADSIIEDTSNDTHYVEQAVTVAATTGLDYAFTVSLRAGERGYARIAMIESTGSHEAYVDLTITAGTLGTPAVSSTNWTNVRAFVTQDDPGTWSRVTIIARKASAGTTVTCRVYMASALGTTSYTGNGTNKLYAWRGAFAQSSFPVTGTQTTTAATNGSSQTGSGLYLKGLPASTAGLLLPGDQFQVGSELKIVTASLDSDASGLGYVQFEPPLRASPADNAPVIIHEPMAKMMLAEAEAGWSSVPGVFSDTSLEFVEDLR